MQVSIRRTTDRKPGLHWSWSNCRGNCHPEDSLYWA